MSDHKIDGFTFQFLARFRMFIIYDALPKTFTFPLNSALAFGEKKQQHTTECENK